MLVTEAGKTTGEQEPGKGPRLPLTFLLVCKSESLSFGTKRSKEQRMKEVEDGRRKCLLPTKIASLMNICLWSGTAFGSLS